MSDSQVVYTFKINAFYMNVYKKQSKKVFNAFTNGCNNCYDTDVIWYIMRHSLKKTVVSRKKNIYMFCLVSVDIHSESGQEIYLQINVSINNNNKKKKKKELQDTQYHSVYTL